MIPAVPARRSGLPRTTSTPRPLDSTGVDADAGTRNWRALWAPFWLWSESPAPDIPVREPKAPARPAPAVAVFLGELDRIRRLLWARHAAAAVVRGLWLGLAIACAALAVTLLRPETTVDSAALALVVGGVTVLGLLFGILSRPSRRRTARMLDRTFVLRERMSTAVEHLTTTAPNAGVRAGIPYLQLADAANVASVLRRQEALGFRLPTRELLLACFWGLTLAILVFLRGVGGAPAVLGAGSVPHFTPVASRPAPTNQPAAIPPGADQATVEEVQAQTDRSNQARQDLQSLANALADHGMTSEAAAQISAGDYARAAEDLRQAASGAPDWSSAGRNALASDLQGAADEMTPGESGLQEATTDAAKGLEQGDQAAEETMNALADAVERTGDQVSSNEDLANQMQAAQARRAAAGGANGEAQPGDAQPAAGADANQGGDQQDPGAGSDAGTESGENGQGNQARDGTSAGAQTDGQSGQGSPGGEPGSSAQPGAAGQDGQGGERGSNQSGGEQDGDSPRANMGGGAGSGEGQERKLGETEGASGESGVQQPKNAVVQQRVTNSDGVRGALSPLAESGETLSLSQESSEPGVQTINDGGSAMLGSGTGVTAGNGTEVQGAVGEAGPDSNHVPGEYRDVVERYFSDGEGP